MIKRTLFLLIALMPLTLFAQKAVGSWFVYPLYQGVPTKVVDTPDIVYYTSLGRLYSYDKANDESREYTGSLSDCGVSCIDYNPAGKFLFVGYDTGNVDLIYDDGRIVNMPDIKEATLAYDKGVNQVDFKDNLAYVATKFGLVVFDTNTATVRQSGIYGKNVAAAGVHGDYLIINADNRNYAIKRSDLINRFENFKDLGENVGVAEMKGIGNSVLVRYTSRVKHLQYDMETGAGTEVSYGVSGTPTVFMRGKDGKIRTVCGGAVYAYDFADNKGTFAKEQTVPSLLNKNAYGMWNTAADFWAADANGLGHYDITGTDIKVKHDRMLPADAVNFLKGAYFASSADGKKIYLCTSGATNTLNPSAVNADYLYINIVGPDGVEDVTPTEGLVNRTGSKITQIRFPTGMDVNPADPDMIAIATQTDGIYIVKDGKQLSHTNPQELGRQHGVYFDPDGNLWAMCLDVSQAEPIKILPASKLKGDLSKITESDWITTKAKDFLGNGDGIFITIPGTNITYFKCALYQRPLCIYDTNGTLTNTADDRFLMLNSLTDQDGKTLIPVYYTALVVDKNNDLWVGTDTGPFKITNPANGFSTDMRITRIKVPRNDGSNFADYLLDGEFVTTIAVDSSNNKWIGTRNSGLYYVSASGEEILDHFTTDNSPLLSNTISKLYMDKNSNELYIATTLGLMRYSTFNGPGEPNYDNVYAFPNPVKPGYSGWITVKGLMANSLVKIADSSGNVVYQGKSDGGMFTWDGCNSAGARVKSGVYYVFASQNESGSSSAAVTKILIMN